LQHSYWRAAGGFIAGSAREFVEIDAQFGAPARGRWLPGRRGGWWRPAAPPTCRRTWTRPVELPPTN